MIMRVLLPAQLSQVTISPKTMKQTQILANRNIKDENKNILDIF